MATRGDVRLARTRPALDELSGGNPKDLRRVRFVLAGVDLDPTVPTALTGLRPDEAWRPSDVGQTGIEAGLGLWILESGCPVTDEFHVQMDALLDRMRPGWSRFCELSRKYAGAFEVSIRCAEAHGPLVQLLPDVAARVAELDATLEFDIYVISDLAK